MITTFTTRSGRLNCFLLRITFRSVGRKDVEVPFSTDIDMKLMDRQRRKGLADCAKRRLLTLPMLRLLSSKAQERKDL